MLNLSVHVYAKQSRQRHAPADDCCDVPLVLTDTVTDPAPSVCHTTTGEGCTPAAMRRTTACLRAWKSTVTPLLLLLSSMALNSAGAAANDTGHNVASLLALIASPARQLELTQPPEPADRSPSSAVVIWRRYPQLTRLARLSTTPSSRARSQLFRDSHRWGVDAAAPPPRAFSRRLGFLSRNASLKRSGNVCCSMDMYCFMCVN